MNHAKGLGDGVLVQLAALFAEGTLHVEDISTPTIIVHGHHDGMNAVQRAVALKTRMSSAMMVVLEDEGHVVVTAAVDMVSDFLHPPTIMHHSVKHEEAPVWSHERAEAALDEVAAAYSKETCKKKLDAVFDQADLTVEKKDEECHRVCLHIRDSVLESYGLTSSMVGIANHEQGSDAIFELMNRRMAALEKMAIVDRRKALQKRMVDASHKERSALYFEHKADCKHGIDRILALKCESEVLVSRLPEWHLVDRPVHESILPLLRGRCLSA
jgi:hypothetical protein